MFYGLEILLGLVSEKELLQRGTLGFAGCDGSLVCGSFDFYRDSLKVKGLEGIRHG